MLLEQLMRLRLLRLNLLRRLYIPLILIPAHLLNMHIIRSIDNPQRPRISPHIRQRRVLAQAGPTKGLHGAIEDSERHVRNEDLGGGNFLQGAFGVGLVDLDGGIKDGKAGSIDFDARARDGFENGAVLGEVFLKGLFGGVVGTHDEPFEGSFGLWDVSMKSK